MFALDDRPRRNRAKPLKLCDGTYTQPDEDRKAKQQATKKSKKKLSEKSRSGRKVATPSRYTDDTEATIFQETNKQTGSKKAGKSTTGKKPKPPTNAKNVTHTDNGTPVVNATMQQIRKGIKGKQNQQLVRIPQVAERSKLYAETAKVIGERESLALPYHGGRMWKVEVKVFDANGASGDNKKELNVPVGAHKKKDEVKASKKTNYKELTPLFRWYRGSLILATLPYILDDIVEVENKMPLQKRWANGMKNDEEDSSDEEWEDERDLFELETKFAVEVSALTESAHMDSYHPMPSITRSWISPDLQRFSARKSALAYADELMKRDLLIDRTLYGYGHSGIRLRPVKPTKKQGLDAGMARFLRDGLWVVGQEEMWIEQRREVYVKKQEKLIYLHEYSAENNAGFTIEDKKPAAAANEDEKKPAAVAAKPPSGGDKFDNALPPANEPSEEKKDDGALLPPAISYVSDNANMPPADKCKTPAQVISTTSAEVKAVTDESDVSFDEGGQSTPVEDAAADAKASEVVVDPATKAIVKRALGTRPPPAFKPSTTYCLNKQQIDQCYAASIDHYEKVMHTVMARSLHHELQDGFDCFRERGRGRFDMELDVFDTEAFSFLTNKKAVWMPIIRKILGEDALLVHKGCFLSLPASETQVYHQDGVHLNSKFQKPCHAVNVFIPLLDCEMINGPTEFCLGTHYLGNDAFVKENVYTPCAEAGFPIIFDYRLGHRGLGNRSQTVRPVVYLTYSAVKSGKEFRDEANFSRKRYRKLGEFAEPTLSREERAKKRRFS